MKKRWRNVRKSVKSYGIRHRSSLSVIMLAFIMAAGVSAGEYITGGGTGGFYDNKVLSAIAEGMNVPVQEAPEVSAESAIVINAETGEVLYEKNPDEKAYPASTTKIMTTLIALETIEKLDSPIDQKVKVPEEAVGIEGSSIYLAAGEEVRLSDLLYGMMLRSGNDAAMATAIIIGGNTENFVDMMNEKAGEVGCTNTNFTNPSGLFDENHYTTARDMALISKAAMENERFREIAGAEEYTATRTSGKYNYFYNKNKTVHQYDGGNGIKIGYTKASGRTLAASAERDGVTLICVVMDAGDWFNDAYRLMDYCFEEEVIK